MSFKKNGWEFCLNLVLILLNIRGYRNALSITGRLTIQTGNIKKKHKGHQGKRRDGREKLGKKDGKWERTLLLYKNVARAHFIVYVKNNGGFNKKAESKI